MSAPDIDDAEFALAKAGGILEHIAAFQREIHSDDRHAGIPLALTLEAVRDLVMEAHEFITSLQSARAPSAQPPDAQCGG